MVDVENGVTTDVGGISAVLFTVGNGDNAGVLNLVNVGNGGALVALALTVGKTAVALGIADAVAFGTCVGIFVITQIIVLLGCNVGNGSAGNVGYGVNGLYGGSVICKHPHFP